MKKTLFALVIVLLLCMSVSATTEQGFYVDKDFGEYKVVYTQRMPHAAMGTGSFYLYFNCGIADSDGNFIVKPVYDKIYAPVEGRARFQKDSLFGFFDENWNVVVEGIYTHAEDYSEGLAHVSLGQWGNSQNGFIDRDGNIAIPLIYNRCESFKDGKAAVAYEEVGFYYHSFFRYGVIDKQGNILEPLIYRHEAISLEVGVAPNTIIINGKAYDNTGFEYPFIYYKGLAYMPLTYHGSRALGFSCDWSPETGIVLSSYDGADGYLEGKSTLDKNRFYKASIYTGKLTVGTKTYTAEDMFYPPLTLGNIVYMPILWRPGMDALGIGYKYELETNSMIFETNK